jgi:uncharacterized protein YndB with AHSA1/START domain
MTERPKLTLERTFKASIEDVWELWTTKDGIESWWGPEGFSVAVRELDLRPGGRLAYAMSAVGADQREYMLKAGMPMTTEHSLTYEVVDPPRRLAYHDVADFIPGVEPYQVETVIELRQSGGDVRMVLTFDAMHDEHWTRMAKLGHESELDRLAAVLASRS